MSNTLSHIHVVPFLVCLLTAGGALAQPGDGIQAGLWKLSPFLDLAGVHDSNIDRSSEGAKEDDYVNSILGVRVGRSSYQFDVSALGFLSRRDYAGETSKSFESAGEIVRVKLGNRDTAVMEVDQSFRRIEDIDQYGGESTVGGVAQDSVPDANSSSRRDINQFGISLGKDVTDKTGLAIGYRFDSVNYESPELLDLDSQGIQAEGSYKMTDRTAAMIILRTGEQTCDSEDDTARYSATRVGLKTVGTEKINLEVGVGAQRYSRPTDAGTKSTFSYDGIASWRATEKTVLQVGGRNGSQMSSVYADNGTEYASFWIAAVCRPTVSLTLSLNGAHRVDDYFDPVMVNGRSVDREDRSKMIRARAEHLTPWRGLRMYLETAYEDMDSNVSSYEATRIGVGLTAQY